METHQHAPEPAQIPVTRLIELLGGIVHDQSVAAEAPMREISRKEPSEPEQVCLGLVEDVPRQTVSHTDDRSPLSPF